MKTLFGLLGIAMVLAFLAPILYKMHQLSLSLVALIGIAMMLYEFWESLREKDD